MEVRRNKKAEYVVLSLLLLMYAYMAKLAARDMMHIFPETCLQFSRHLVHMGLIFCWLISVKQRIRQPSVRRYLLASGGFLAFWLFIRTCKWMFFPGDSWANRYCWYAFYVPLIFVPLFGAFLIQYLGKKEEFELTPKWKILYLPAWLLLLLVFTNDLHQLVFQFPSGVPFSDWEYEYGIGYFFIVGWSLLLGIYFVAALLWKCRAPGKQLLRKMPLFVLLLEIVITVLYCLKILRCDLTALDCLMIVLLLESCIQSGLICSNSDYDRLFKITDIEAQITDDAGNVYYASRQTEQPEAQVRAWMTDQEHIGTIWDGKRLNGAKLANGYVLWWEEVSEILSFTEELEKIGQQLSEKNDLLKAELELREKQLQVVEKNRLYDRMAEEVSGQLDQIEQLLREKHAENARKRLAHICVLGAYVKRHCNLRLLSENTDRIQAKELEFCLKESVESLCLYGIMAAMDSDCQGETEAEWLIALYDVFEQLTEQTMTQMNAMLLKLSVRNDQIYLKVQISLEEAVDLPKWKNWIALGGAVHTEKSEDAWYLEFTGNTVSDPGKTKSGSDA